MKFTSNSKIVATPKVYDKREVNPNIIIDQHMDIFKPIKLMRKKFAAHKKSPPTMKKRQDRGNHHIHEHNEAHEAGIFLNEKTALPKIRTRTPLESSKKIRFNDLE